MKRIISLMLALALGLMAFPVLAAENLDITSLYKEKDTDDTWSEDAAVITLLDSTAQSDDSSVKVTGSTVTITGGGEYVLTGSLQGQIVIETTEAEKVHLILRGVTITSPSGPAIYEKLSDKLIVTLAEGTVNTLSDTTSVQDGEDGIAAALYAEDDLSINGKGTLVVMGNAGNGIHSKADLVIADGDLQVTAANDGIKGRNSVLVLEGSLRIQSGGDGIVSTRDNKEGKGYVVIAGGELSIKTGSGAGEAARVTQRSGWNGRGGRGGMRWDWDNQATTGEDSASIKGIKAATELTICGGTIAIDSEDDALHADQITVSGGQLEIRTGDDGMHADTALTIQGGRTSILQSYEGIESAAISIEGGVTTVLASDDGVNATSGNAASGMNREASDGSMLSISGGELYVTADFDGLDSNGNIRITGGVVGLAAMSGMGDSYVDYNGSCSISGGTILVATSGNTMGGMNVLNGAAVMAVSASGNAGSEIQLLKGDGTLLGSFVPQSSFNTILVASSGLNSGDACEVRVASQTVYSGAMNTSSYAGGGSNGNWNFGTPNMGGGHGGGHGGRGGW